jgi:O-antigen ligase
MNSLKNFRLPYAEDKLFGLLLLMYILVSLVIITVFSEPIDSPRLFIWSVLLGLAAWVWLRQLNIKIYLSRWSLGLSLLLIGWSVVATIFSLDSVNSLVGVNIRMTSSLWFFLLWSATIIILSTLHKQKLVTLLRTVSVIAGVVSIWGILQYYGIGFYDGANPEVRDLIPSFLGNPNFAAMFVASSLFLNLWNLFTTKSWYRLMQLLFIASHVASLMIFASRGALLGVAVGFIVVILGLLIKKQWKLSLISLGVVVVIGAVSYSFLGAIRSETLTSIDADQSAAQRWYAWDNSFSEIAKNPLVGSGLGNYFISYRQNQESYMANMNWFDDPHNVFLHLAVNGGLPLALIVLILSIMALWKLTSQYILSKEVDYLSLFVAAGFASWLIAALFNPVSVTNWLLATLLVATALQTEKFIEFKNNFARAGLQVVSVILMVAGLCFILSEVTLWQSIRTSSENRYKLSEQLAHISVGLNPTNLVAIHQLAMTQYFNSNLDGSFQSLKQEESLHPLSAGVYNQTLTGYMNLYKQSGDEKYKTQIYESIQKYQDSFDNHQFIHQNLATFYFQLGDFDNSLKHARRWVVLSQGNYSSWLFLAGLYQAMGQPELELKAKMSAFQATPYKELRENIQNSK